MPSCAGAERTAFMRRLRADRPASDTAGVAVPPDLPGDGLHQYAALGRAANLAQIATHDQHDPGIAPGPIAATARVQRVRGYAAWRSRRPRSSSACRRTAATGRRRGTETPAFWPALEGRCRA